MPGKGERGVAAGQAPALTVCDRWDDGTVTVTVCGDIDISTAGTLSDRLAEVAGRSPVRLVIDLAEVGFMDSAGLNALVRLRKALPGSCPIVLRSAKPRTLQVFKLTGLTTVFEFE